MCSETAVDAAVRATTTCVGVVAAAVRYVDEQSQVCAVLVVTRSSTRQLLVPFMSHVASSVAATLRSR